MEFENNKIERQFLGVKKKKKTTADLQSEFHSSKIFTIFLTIITYLSIKEFPRKI